MSTSWIPVSLIKSIIYYRICIFINNQCIPVLCKCIVHFAIPSVWMRLTNQSIIHRVVMSCPCLSNHPCSDHHSPDRHQCCRGRGASTTISSSSFQHFLTFSSHPLFFVCPSRTHFAWEDGSMFVLLQSRPKKSKWWMFCTVFVYIHISSEKPSNIIITKLIVS